MLLNFIQSFFCLALLSTSPLNGREVEADGSDEEITLHLSDRKSDAQQDLASLFFRSYKCVDSASKNVDGTLTIKFANEDCYMYETALKAQKVKNSFGTVRDEWQYNYMQHVEELKTQFKIPKTLEGFIEFTDYLNWDSEVIDSEIKDKPRTIYRNFDFRGHTVRVAESLLEKLECSHVENCKEVEVAISLGEDHVFLVYDELGKLVSHAQFPGRRLKAPLSCNGCHYNQETRRVDRLFKPQN